MEDAHDAVAAAGGEQLVVGAEAHAKDFRIVVPECYPLQLRVGAHVCKVLNMISYRDFHIRKRFLGLKPYIRVRVSQWSSEVITADAIGSECEVCSHGVVTVAIHRGAQR